MPNPEIISRLATNENGANAFKFGMKPKASKGGRVHSMYILISVFFRPL